MSSETISKIFGRAWLYPAIADRRINKERSNLIITRNDSGARFSVNGGSSNTDIVTSGGRNEILVRQHRIYVA